MEQKNFILSIGISGVGKTFYINENYKESIIVSKDKILIEQYPLLSWHEIFIKLESRNERKKIERIYLDEIRKCLKMNKTIIIDDNSLDKKFRKEILNLVSNKYHKIALVFPVLKEKEITKSIQFRSTRDNKYVSESMIHKQIELFNKNNISLTEGFDEIIKL